MHEHGGFHWGSAREAVPQGDSHAGDEFSVVLQPDVRYCYALSTQFGGFPRFGNDYGYLIGFPDAVFLSLGNFSKKCFQHM